MSLGFLRVQKIGKELCLEKIGQGWVYVPQGRFRMGWKGMQWEGHLNYRAARFFYAPPSSVDDLPAIIEIDWNSDEAGIISVDRNDFSLSEKSQSSLRVLENHVRGMYRVFLQEQGSSAYATLNYRVVGDGVPAKPKWSWLTIQKEKETEKATWSSLSFPSVSSLSFVYMSIPSYQLKWKKKLVPVIRCLGEIHDGDHYKGLLWNSNNIQPDRIVKYFDYRQRIVGLWTEKPKPGSSGHIVGTTCHFPPKWSLLCGVFFEYQRNLEVWNPDHPLLRIVDSASWEWSREVLQNSLDPLLHREEILVNPSKAATWILRCLQKKQKDLWEGLKDRDPLFLTEVWRLLFGSRSKLNSQLTPYVCQWIEDPGNQRLYVLSPKGWTIYRNESDVERFLPDPGAEWCIEKDNEEIREYKKQLRLMRAQKKSASDRK